MGSPQPDLSAWTLGALFAETASAETSAAAGSASALCGYLGVSVLLKCIRISARRQPADPAFAECESRLLSLAERLLGCAQADADSFSAFRRALRLPKTTSEEASARKSAMQTTGTAMTTAALDILDIGNEILHLIGTIRDRLAAPVVADAHGGAEIVCAMIATSIGNAEANLANLTGHESLRQRLQEAKRQGSGIRAQGTGIRTAV